MAYTADFETCDDRTLTGGTPTEVHVWLWALCDIEDLSVSYGTDIYTFLWELHERASGDDVWFHNLAYDGTHILDCLLHAGWKWSDRKKKGTFETLISDTGKFYHIGITWGDGRHVDIYDSLKKFPFSVDALGKRFDIPEQKGHIDYTSWRDWGYVPTCEEYGYIHNDVVICARAMQEDYRQGYTRMTIGSDCMKFYKEDMGKGRFAGLFPKLNYYQDRFIREAYRGGYTYVAPEYKGETVGPGISVDYNSMYPSQMLVNPFPVGKPVYFAGEYQTDPDYPIYVQRVRLSFWLKPDGLPMLQLKRSPWFGEHEYADRTDEPVELVLSSVDIKIVLQNYDVEIIEYLGGYKFKAAYHLFDDYINYWRDIKEASTGIQRQIAKLFSNNLYGKYGSNPDTGSKIPYLGDSGIVEFQTVEDSRDPVYIPVAVFVTAYARKALIDAIHANRDRFIYCDTDSMHLLGTDDPRGIALHDTHYNAWKVEGRFTRAKHLRAKTYIWDLNGKLEVKCAGMPQNMKAHIGWDDFEVGYSNMDEHGEIREGEGKLVPLMVKGGRTLVDRPFQIR